MRAKLKYGPSFVPQLNQDEMRSRPIFQNWARLAHSGGRRTNSKLLRQKVIVELFWFASQKSRDSIVSEKVSFDARVRLGHNSRRLPPPWSILLSSAKPRENYASINLRYFPA